MKKIVCGIVIGMVVSTGIQASAISKRWSWQSHEVNAINEIGKILHEICLTQQKMYSKLKSIDQRLTLENDQL